MICVLIGIVPPIENQNWEEIQHNISKALFYNNIDIQWRDNSLAIDNGCPTLIVEAITDSTPDKLVPEVEVSLNQLRHDFTYSCELWATAPAPLPLRPLEGYENILRHQSDNDISWTSWASTVMQKFGIIVQDQILDSTGLSELSSYVNNAIIKTESAISCYRPDIKIGKDFFCFKEIASRNLERFDLRLTDDDTVNFVTKFILAQSSVNSFLHNSLGPIHDVDFDISVVYSRPGACAQGWHADGSHQKEANDAGWQEDGWKTQLTNAYAICLFLPLINLNENVGFTQFWPGSHRSRDFLGFGPVAEITQSTFDGICNAGDGVWYDYRLIHRGMPNNSNVVRPVLQVIFKKKWYIEKANYGVESIQGSDDVNNT